MTKLPIQDRVRFCEVCGGTFKSIRPKVTVHGSGRPCMYIFRGAKVAGLPISKYLRAKGSPRPAPIHDVPESERPAEQVILPEIPLPPVPPSPFSEIETKKPTTNNQKADFKAALLSGIEDLNLIEPLPASPDMPFPEADQVSLPDTIKKMVRSRTHLIIPDCQVKEGVPTEHLEWVGKYIALKRPDVIVCIGDFADMESLSLYDKGKKIFEGRTYAGDIQAARRAMKLLVDQFRHIPGYNPRMILLIGNHEYRIIRACEIDRELSGTFKMADLGYESFGWEVYPFLDIVKVDGIEYSHYFTSGVMGRPVSSAAVLLRERQGSAIMGHVQYTDMAIHKKTQKIAMFVGTCLTPDHKVLTADLRYVPLGSIQPGDKLVSFDEASGVDGKRSRRYATGTVENTRIAPADVYAVTLSDGKTFKTTADHRWLTRLDGGKQAGYRWVETSNLRPRAGDRHGTRIPKLQHEWEALNSFEAGWLAGMYDGEGCLWTRNTTGGECSQLSISQKEGPVLDRVRRGLELELGLSSRTETYQRSASTLRIKGGVRSIAKVLGQLRPTRLLSKFSPETLGRVATQESAEVLSVEFLGQQDVVQVAIDAGTMVVEGYGHHNCYLHDEPYLTPQGNDQRRQIIMLHEVNGEGHFDPMFVSLDYLSRRFGDGRRIFRGLPHEERPPARYVDDSPVFSED